MCYRPPTAAKPKACPSCGALNPPFAKKCDNCGGELIPDEVPTVPGANLPPRPPSASSKICLQCGTENPPFVKKCGKCGKEFA